MKIQQKIRIVLLPTILSSVYGGDYFEDNHIDDRRVNVEQGDVVAQGILEWMYERGQGVPRVYKEANKWFRKTPKQ